MILMMTILLKSSGRSLECGVVAPFVLRVIVGPDICFCEQWETSRERSPVCQDFWPRCFFSVLLLSEYIRRSVGGLENRRAMQAGEHT